MDAFINIRIKRETAERFQQFSKTHYKTHTDAMAGMLDFFFYNEISPKENFGPTGRRIENILKKRINAMIAIMKDIEKTQTNPTAGMLMALLEQAEPKKKPLILENNNFRADIPRPESNNEDRIFFDQKLKIESLGNKLLFVQKNFSPGILDKKRMEVLNKLIFTV